jgi:hypothetical protein
MRVVEAVVQAEAIREVETPVLLGVNDAWYSSSSPQTLHAEARSR